MSQVEQLADLYAILIQASGLMARADTSAKLYIDICRLGIQLDRRMMLAWLGMLDPEGSLLTVASAGPAVRILDNFSIGMLSEQDPIHHALHIGKCMVVRGIDNCASTQSFKDQASDFGISSCAAIPLRQNGTTSGVLMLYASSVDVFDKGIAGELDVLAQSLSYALDTATQRERDRRQSERWRSLLHLVQTDEYDGTQGETDFLHRAIEQARRLTGSQIGSFNLISDDRQGCSQVVRSDNSDRNPEGAAQLNPIGPGNIWIGSFLDHQGLIINNYFLPDVGKESTRLALVPVIDNEKIVAIAWIGGKSWHYDQDDLEYLQILASDAWRIVRRHRAEDGLLEAHKQLLQSEKMASIGQLAAGVAHEINNPIGFVSSNIGSLSNYIYDLMSLAEAASASPDGIEIAERIDLEFLRSDIPALLAESKEGLDRVRKIVQDLKDFSRVGETNWQEADIHQGLDSTLNIAINEIKYKCTVTKLYGDLPPVYCLLSQLNQVFMNLLVNAAQSIEAHGEIVIRTERVGNDSVRVSISDTGSGIAPEHIDHLFEPFFTTKPVGKGTGLGLSLAWSIVSRHHGRIDVVSEVGKGSTFTITLPIRPDTAPFETTKVVAPAPQTSDSPRSSQS